MLWVHLQVQLSQLDELMPLQLAEHLEDVGCPPDCYARPWLKCAFAPAFPLDFTRQVLDATLEDRIAVPALKVRKALSATLKWSTGP